MEAEGRPRGFGQPGQGMNPDIVPDPPPALTRAGSSALPW